MTRPFLSIVMPVHGGGRWLDAALASMADDVPGALEVIVRDSTPDGPCREAVDKHAARLAIDYQYVPEVASWTRKTNMGVEAARAKHVCTLHQDDLWLDQRLAQARRMAASWPDAAMCFSPSLFVDGADRRLGTWHPPFAPGVVDPERCREMLLVQNSIAIPAPIVRRDAWLAVGGLDESLWYTPDWDMWLKLAGHGPVVYDREPTTAFRIHPESQTMTGKRDEFARQLEVVRQRHSRPGGRTERLALASTRINTALSDSATGRPMAIFRALAELAALGPVGAVRYLHASRLFERTLPRLRLRLSGAM